MNCPAIQSRIKAWIIRMFGLDVYNSPRERIRRFLEEAVELAQSMDVPEQDILDLIAHVYSRPVGKVNQELGGVGITLLALCQRLGYDFGQITQIELCRIESLPEDHFRQRQAVKAAAGISMMPAEMVANA